LNRYIALVDRYLVQWLHWIRHGETRDERMSRRGHCNLQTFESVRSLTERCGFQIVEAFVEDTYDKHQVTNVRHIANKIFGRSVYTKRNIYLYAHK
jgi:hypothetical protein